MDKIISSLQDKGIQVWLENERLMFSGTRANLTNEIIKVLSDNKKELEEYLKNESNQGVIAKAMSNQMALWLERKMGNKGGHIHNGMVKHITCDLNIDYVKEAFVKVMKKHDALTLTFEEDDEVVLARNNEVDANFFSFFEKEDKEAKQFIEDGLLATMDLQNGPLFKVIVCKCGENNYYLGFGVHHIISDAYSLYLIEHDFYQYYFELIDGKKSKSNINSSYLETILREREYLDSDEYKNDLKFWKDNLDVEIQGTSMPKFKINKESRKYVPVTYIQTFSNKNSEKIKLFAKKHQFTPYILLFSIFNLGIHYMNEKKENSIGLFAANRLDEKNLKEVGYYSNAIVYQDKYDCSKQLLDYCQEVKKRFIKDFVHQHLPFTDLVRELSPSREGGMPFFNLVFDSLLFPKNEETVKFQKRLCCEEIALIKGSGDYDLIVWAYEKNDCYEFEYRYNGEHYDEYQIDSLASVVEGIMDSLENETIALGHIPALHGKHKEIIDNSNKTEIEIENKNVYEMFCEKAEKTPNRIAIKFKEKVLTYKEVKEIANNVGNEIVKREVHKQKYVGIMMQKGINLIPVILGVWAAGAIYVPIDPNFPVKRQEYMINNTGITVLIKDETKFEATNNIEIIDADSIINGSDNTEKNKTLSPKFRKDEPAYILYTSGSTGNPKGVVISHGALINFVTDMRKSVQFGEDDTIMSTASICFDMSILEMFLPISTGACVVMVPYEETKSGKYLLKTIQDYGVTFMQATPSSYEMLYDYFIEGNIAEPILKTSLCGGESYDLDLVNKIQKMSVNMYNAYGPTETTVWSSVYKIPNNCQKLKIGKPISNTVIRIVDDNKKEVPLGVPGELLIGGKGVFNGYCNAPELTEKALIKTDSGEKFYCTGDWAYWDSEGNLVFLGRRDSQIKIRGYRIEISEIENVFRSQPSVSNVAVVTVKQNGIYSIVAALTLKSGEQYDKEEIMNSVSQSLPEYMRPNEIMVLDEIPMTTNNKVDKKTITEMAQEKLLNTSSKNNLAETEQEKKINELWNEVIGTNIKSIDKGFFEVGGNSLLLNKLALKLQKEYKKEVDIIELLTYNTIRKMADYLSDNIVETKIDKNKLNENANRRSSFIRRRKS